MKLSIDEKEKLFCIYLNHADQQNPFLQARLKALYQEYKQKKYCVAVLRSGQESLEGLTRDLLLYNRGKKEEMNLAAEKTAERNAKKKARKSAGFSL